MASKFLTIGFLCATVLGIAAGAETPERLYLESLLDFERYAETIWHDASGATVPADSGYWGDGGSFGNGGIRGLGGVAVAYAVLVEAFPEDPRNEIRISHLTKALNYAANTHRSGTRICIDHKRWGHGWQTAEWAGSLGFACLLVQNKLPVSTVRDVQKVVASEADFRSRIPPASGYIADTKSEENAWNSNVLALGAAWMTTHTNAAAWLTAAKKYMANTYSVTNTAGDPLASWITTVTLYPSFGLENHGFYHPTYAMVGGMSLGDSLLMARLANPTIARELQPFAEHNVMQVWTNNLQYMLTDSGDFAYPSGLDWELHDYEQKSYLTWLATHFNDPVARWANGKISRLVRERQIVNGDGRFVGPSVQNGFFREAVEARRTAFAWLMLTHGDHPTGRTRAPGPAIAYFPDAKIIVHRSEFGFVGLSFGRRIMAIVEPPAPAEANPANVFVTTPRSPGIMGLGETGKPTLAQLISLRTNAGGFDVEFKIENDTNGFTEVYLRSTGESLGIVEVPVPVLCKDPAGAGSFSVGIENDPLSGNSRQLDWAGGSTNIASRSGTSCEISNHWICVSGRYGIVAGPAGHFSYQTSTNYNRSGGAEDTLQFVPADPQAARYAVWFPGKNAAETAARAAKISWNVSGASGVFEFPGAAGAAVRIPVRLPEPPIVAAPR